MKDTAHVSLSATAQPPHADACHQAWSGATKHTATHPPPLSPFLVKPKTMPPLVRVDAGSEGRNTFLNHALEWGTPAVVLLLLVCILPYALLGAGHTGAGAAAAGSNSPGRARACSAWWCGRRSTNQFVVPKASTKPPGSEAALKQNRKRTAVLSALKIKGTDKDLRYCALHKEGGDKDAPFLPLHNDPVFTGKEAGIQLEHVLQHQTTFGAAMLEATRQHSTDWNAHPGAAAIGAPRRDAAAADAATGKAAAATPSPGLKVPGSPSPGRRKRGSPSSPAASSRYPSPLHTPTSATQATARDDRSAVRDADKHANPASRDSPARQLADAVDEKDVVIAGLERKLKAAEAQAAAAAEQSRAKMAPMSCSQVTGPLRESCASFTAMSADKLECVVEGCEAMGVHDVWEEAITEEAKHDHVSAPQALALGFRSAVVLCLCRCKAGASEQHLAWMFNLADPQLVGTLFRVTVLGVNKFLSLTVALIPDVFQLDRDELPAFKDPDFANTLLTLDATNVRIDTPHNPTGNKHSHSDYYGGCNFKTEIGSDPTG